MSMEDSANLPSGIATLGIDYDVGQTTVWVPLCQCVPPQRRDVSSVSGEQEVDHRLHLKEKQNLKSATEEGRRETQKYKIKTQIKNSKT